MVGWRQCYYGQAKPFIYFYYFASRRKHDLETHKDRQGVGKQLEVWGDEKEEAEEEKKRKMTDKKGRATDRRRQMPPFGISTKAPESSSPRAIAALQLNEVRERGWARLS